MKTFETEKHNIPEGATHYADECEGYYFTWMSKRADGVTYLYSNSSKEWNPLLFKRDLKPIPQTKIETPEEKEVEWVNGDTVEYRNKHEGEGVILTFVGINPTHKGHAVLYGKHLAGGYVSAPLSMLSKPETEVERVEREKLEAAYDLYCTALSENKDEIKSFDHFKNYKYKCGWLAIVDKTNYRKDSE